ncbi:RibD family protein [Pseudomonas sp. JV449]|uniref:RibD family protein n=1 Tax=Pseudomonas sp. JV449 TaxID=1890658 RepID=UPI0028E17F76|nr:dihydrofolate reductase family protein [Pseudomonas sp. JV449]MDT9632891.1 RibD family protein [Pseudomonas sp. JV449]
MLPRIICHMISSVDGRLVSSRWTPLPNGDSEQTICNHYELIADRLGGDGFIIGRTTMEAFDGISSKPPLVAEHSGGMRDHYIAHEPGDPVAIVIDPSGKLHYQTDTIDGGHRIISILGDSVSDAYLQALRNQGISYLFAGPHCGDLKQALAMLGAQFGLKTLLLEGGGVINGTFLKAGLIDEISLLIYPGIDGLSGVPSIFEYHGQSDERPASGQSLRHISTQTIEDGFIWARYLVAKMSSDT